MKGRVLELRGDTVLVEPLPELENSAPPAACHGCAFVSGSGEGCAAVKSPAGCPQGPVLVKKPGGPELVPGQTVELRRRGLASQAAAALLPPAAGFAAGYTLAARIIPSGEFLAGLLAGEGARAAVGVGCMFLAALGFYRFRRRYPAGSSFTIGPARFSKTPSQN
jgi:hypothetical protein